LSQCACHIAVNQAAAHNVALNYDPTRTITLRRRWSQDMAGRFIRVRAAVREAVVDNDVLGLTDSRLPINVVSRNQQLEIPGFKAYDFPRASEKVDAFMSWLREMANKEIMGEAAWEAGRRTGERRLLRSADQRWTDVYVRTAYQRGIAHGRRELNKVGIPVPAKDQDIRAAFNQPFHAERVGLLYSRVFTDLRGVTDAMAQQMSRVLAQGLAEGINPRQMARNLSGRVDKIGITRARTIARTETIRAQAEAAINEYEAAGIDQIDLKVEWATAGFNVCPICIRLAGRGPYTTREIRGMIPAHPNCRCAPIPHTRGIREQTRERLQEAQPAPKPKPKPKPAPTAPQVPQRVRGEVTAQIARADLARLNTYGDIEKYLNDYIPSEYPIKGKRFKLGADMGIINARRISTEIFDLNDNFPEFTRTLKGIDFTKATKTSEGKQAFGMYYGGKQKMSIHVDYFTKKKLSAKKHGVKVGWSVYCPDSDLWRYTLNHEFGHHVDRMLGLNAKHYRYRDWIIDNKGGKIVSEYASTRSAETFAELFASMRVSGDMKGPAVDDFVHYLSFVRRVMNEGLEVSVAEYRDQLRPLLEKLGMKEKAGF